MNKKNLYSIALGISISILPSFAADEVADLRSQLEFVIKRLDELETGTEKDSWAGKIKHKGDFRYRYEYKAEGGDTDANRHRIRARIGAYADVNEQVKAGVRIATGSDDSPTSTNQTVDDNANKKEFWMDLAYLTYNPEAIDGLNLTFGKMKQPWVSVSDLIFDTDVNPEGIAASHTCGNDLSITTALGYHIMDENTGDDVELISGQVSASTQVKEDMMLTIGTGAFIFNNIDRIEPIGYDIIDGFAQLDIKKGLAPIKIYGEALSNVDSGAVDGDAWLVGIGTKYKKVGFDYNYRDLGNDSVWNVLDDGDFGGPDGKGHKVKANYTIAKNFTAGATYFRIDQNETDVDLLQLDLMVKF